MSSLNLGCTPQDHIKLILSLLVFQQFCSSICCKRALVFTSFIPFLFLFRRHCDAAFFNHHLVLSNIMFVSCYPFYDSVVPSFQVFSHLIKLLLNSFSFQPECCSKLFLLVALPYRSVFNFVFLVAFFLSIFSTFQGS